MFPWITLIQQKIQGYGKQNKTNKKTVHDNQRAARPSSRRPRRPETIDFIELKDNE